MSRKRERENPCFICNHYHNFDAGETCGVCGHGPAAACASERLQPASAFPTEVIPDFLYLGSYDHAARSELLKAMGISRILNTVPECQNLYKNTFHYHTASALPGAPKQVPIDECVAFIEECAAAGQKVMVHCMSGTSRSPSVAIAYLIKRHRWRLAHVHAWLQQRRPSVALQHAAAEQLAAYELAMLGDEALTPPPPLPPHNPLPTNDSPFGVPPVAPPAGPFQLPGTAAAGWGGAAGAAAGGFAMQQPQQGFAFGGGGPPPAWGGQQ